MNDQQIQELIKLYGEHWSVKNLSKYFDCHRITIQRHLKRNGIQLRKRGSKHPYSINFFKSYTPESVYWAGFICADGYIRKNKNAVEIKLHKQDKDHLKKFLNSIKSTNLIKDYYNYSTISISGKFFVEDLEKFFSIVNKKSLIAKIDQKIPCQFIHHFIRGYFDGNGSVTFTSCPTISFSSGSKSLIKDLIVILHCFTDIKLKTKSKILSISKTSENCYAISLSGKNAKKVLNWMYKEASSDLYLQRKFDKSQELFKVYS